MTNDVQKFDPARLMDGVRDRIKATFVALIPDEQWDTLVQQQVEAFFKMEVQEGYSKKYTQFQYVCSEILRDMTKDKIKEFLNTYHTNIWENNTLKLSDAFLQLLKNNASELFVAMMRQQISSVIYDMKQRGY